METPYALPSMNIIHEILQNVLMARYANKPHCTENSTILNPSPQVIASYYSLSPCVIEIICTHSSCTPKIGDD